MFKRLLSFMLIMLPILASAAPVEKTKDLTLMLEWFINPDHAPIIVAQQKGYFEQEGLNVTIQEPADPNLPPKLVAAGSADIAVYYQHSLNYAVDSGIPLVWAGTLVATPLDGLIVLEEGKIKNLEDMKGKTIGVSTNGNRKVLLDTLFKPHGFGYDDIKIVNVGWNLSSSLMTGRVDAIIGAYRNFELNELILSGSKGKMFYYEENGIPPYDELIFIANRDKHDKEAIRRFLRAVELGAQFIANNPDKSWEIFRDSNPRQLDNKLNKRAWFDTIPYLARRPAAKDTGRYQRVADFLYENKELKKPQKAEDLMISL
ncbi:ABC transporter substrate-binding protein [Endozoicomonas euniceicola]|uniref:ABC transporter substrate-binding protein n=1 Tax=Endozoicomonas euniceicola TaxID=1234143 RepID=A0ABY6H148_9GAMM|nr:ABC transporter substrate-binding protein [Endozoicomonas euniceicola]UYM18768.1 ABC transporter substrate-binding protein [Endozoicomonas euniceicola]